MHPEATKYLRFQWKDRTYEFTSLPFGSSPSVVGFHLADKTNYLHTEEMSYPDSSLSGQYANYGKFPKTTERAPAHSHQPPLPFGVYPEQQEMCIR